MSGPKPADASALLNRGNASSLTTMAVVMIVLGALVIIAPSYWQYIATIGIAQVVVGLSIGVVYGTAGMLSLAQLSLAAIGSWAVGWFTADLGLVPLPWSILLGAIAAVPIGILVALPALRLRGVNLAVVTLGFVIVIYSLASTQVVPGSQQELFVKRPEWLASDGAFFVFSWCALVLLIAGVILLRRSRWGFAWIAIARSERAAASLGVSIIKAKISAFAVSAFLAGWAGGIFITVYGSTDSGTFSPLQALLFFVLAVMFGAGYWEGALALGVLNTVLSAVLRQWNIPPDVGSILFGIGAIQVLSTGSRAGFSGDIRRLISRVRRRRSAASDPVVELISAPRLSGTSDATAVPAVGDETAASSRGAALEVSGLTVKYGAVVALDAVDLIVPRGKIVGLVGPNGAGKSTLIDAVTGFTQPSAGTVRAAGRDVAGMPVFRRSAFVRRTFQTERTMDELTAVDFLRLAARSRPTALQLQEMLDFIGCSTPHTPLRHLDVRTRRLLMMAGCLMGSPSVVLLDEPAAGLDADESVDLASRIREIPERYGCGVLLIEHDMDLVRLACEEVTVLDFGKVIASGPTADVLDDPTVARAYLGEEVETND